MAIDRKLWVHTFVDKESPSLPCASCAKGTLRIADLQTAEPTYSNARDQDGWEPTWVQERFVAFARCDIRECGEVVSIIGSTTTHEEYDEDGPYYYKQHRIAAMVPGPRIIQLPSETPVIVQTEIEKAFELFWSDPGSCANRLRVSVERLLDHFKVKKLYIQKGEKQRPYSLNDRIGMFNKEAELLHALRLIGNLGSHGTATRKALLDAFDIYLDVLQALLSTRRVSIAALARKIRKTKARY